VALQNHPDKLINMSDAAAVKQRTDLFKLQNAAYEYLDNRYKGGTTRKKFRKYKNTKHNKKNKKFTKVKKHKYRKTKKR